MKLFGPSRCLQNDFNLISEWCNNNNKRLNKEKCVYIQFGSRALLPFYNLDGNYLKTSVSEKDLGIIIDDKLSFENHINSLIKRSFCKINSIFKGFPKRHTSVYLFLYKVYILPSIDYCSEIYFPRSVGLIDRLENIQRRFTKRLFSKSCKLSYLERCKTLKLFPLELRSIIISLRTMYKLTTNTLIVPSPIYTVSLNPYNFASKRLRIDSVNTELRRSFFSHRMATIWNSLPLNVRCSQSLNEFMRSVRGLTFSKFLKGRIFKAH